MTKMVVCNRSARSKAVAPNSIRPAWFDGLPAALSRGNWLHVLLAVTVWPTLVLFLAGVGLTVNCAPLGLGIRDSLTALWRDEKRAASGRRLAVITLVGYPWLRGFVDPSGFILFQFQRYYAHLTPLFILAALGAWPVTGAVVRRKYWDWQGTPLRAQRFRSCCWGAMSGLLMAILCAVSVWNINSMQVPLGHWVRENTSSDQLVATNDIGAIGFVSERRILDTVGLVEPKLVEHYLAGGDLLGYLKSRDPAYVIIFPEWYKDLSSRADLLEEVHSVTLGLNVICGGSRMVVYRPHWKKGSG